MEYVLGVDTSNYTTSLCAVDFRTGKPVAESRKLLPVKTGERGLRQSDALFFHVRQLPGVMDELLTALRTGDKGELAWRGIGVSVHPRPLSASYMPVFLAGLSFAEMMGRMLGIPVVRASHQEGHLAAAQAFLEMPCDAPFLGIHLSGGTSDVLYASPTRFGYHVEAIGEGADLHAGQFVDRVGVALGYPFPAGPYLERLAQSVPENSSFRLPGSGTGVRLSFSGPCSAALRAIEQGVSAPAIAFAVETCIANSVSAAVELASQRFPQVRRLVVAGGVASNQHIRQRVEHRLGIVAPHIRVHFAPARYASDNAVGPACIARRFLYADRAENSIHR